MKKRIGSKLYDTETSEHLCAIDGGQLYQKRTRDREYFAAMDDGTIRPLDVYDPMDMLLMETGKDISFDDPGPSTGSVMIRVDRQTHAKISGIAKRRGISIGEAVKQMAEAEET